ncbi:MAG: porin family protein [Bacteroidales bacterium]|nr:porin family protein [Candidatus Colimorpha pelethequi]
MKKILLLLFVVLGFVAQGQRIHGYISAGAVAAQMEGDELKGFNHWGLSTGVGAITDLSRNGAWRLGVEADFSQRGAKNSSATPYSIDLNLSYVDVPVTVYFRDPYGGIMFGFGLAYSRLVQQPHDVIKYDPYSFMPDTSDMSFLKNDFSVALELRFAVWKGLQLSFRYQRSLFPIKREWGFSQNEGIRWNSWSNDCFNSALTMRLLWVFGDQDKPQRYMKKKHRRR